MPGAQEILLAVRGALGLALGDRQALTNFDQSADAFFRSFYTLLLALPFYLLIISAEWRIIHETGAAVVPIPFAQYMASRLTMVGLIWVLFPIAAALVARTAGLTRHYAPYIIVYNWAQLPVLAALAGPYLLYSLGLLPSEGVGIFHTLLFFGILWYRWRIAVMALGANVWVAAGLVVLSIALELMLEVILTPLVR